MPPDPRHRDTILAGLAAATVFPFRLLALYASGLIVVIYLICFAFFGPRRSPRRRASRRRAILHGFRHRGTPQRVTAAPQ